ncbi:MAG TPA: N-acetylmuramoyl-L-alanine amidase [Acidimicrobiales bacterium]|nr:N-acetylmuramoyl-L-alanine amidase [Acidimicrobiales bacterium]
MGAAAGAGLAGATWSATRHRKPASPAAGKAGSPHSGATARTTGSTVPRDLLTGLVVGLDPGHNGNNWDHTGYINQSVWNGREEEACDTTGTQEASGYTEAQFAFNVAQNLAALLRDRGATVVLTRTTNTGFGPCITERASIVNNAGAHVAVSIHADGGPVTGRGFSILEPVASGVNDAVIGPSQVLGDHVRSAFLSETPMPVSDYYGVNGVVPRDDLGGLNLTTVPKVMVECGNMPNPTDAALLVDPGFQQQAATALAMAITTFLTDAAPGHAPSTTAVTTT